jgi:uncharacterized pyridoxal phosphate-containing UPF0001 family protein
MSVITRNLVAVKNHIEELSKAAGRPGGAVKLIAVSKTRTLEEVRQAAEAGQSDFGENTVERSRLALHWPPAVQKSETNPWKL